MTHTESGGRKAAAAGTFYPANAVELTKTIASLFAEVEKVPLIGRPMALIAPHAGYVYSGKTAAKAYKLLEGEEFETVVIVSPSHTVFFKGASVYEGAGYETPLGLVETNKELSEKIATVSPSVYFSNMGHAAGSTRGEHALEVQLPFLQVALGKFNLVAIVMGEQDATSTRALGETLASAIKGTNTLLVASTDLSHYHPEKEARNLDFAVQKAIEQFDPDLLLETLESGEGEACGGGPVASVMMATKRLGGGSVQFLEYSNSGTITGDFDEVVGYLSAAIIEGDKPKTVRRVLGSLAAKPGELSGDARKVLKEIATEAIRAKLKKATYQPPDHAELGVEKGVFVTLNLAGKLRGCIGLIKARVPLNQAVAEMAVAAAFDDPRFTPLTSDESEQLEIEISVMSKLERVYDFKKIQIGRDGLLIRLDGHSGLLLPQVAKEHDWDTKNFLEETCLKAGLPAKAYKEERAIVFKFRAEIF